jgi:hypothetical protein
VQLSFIQLDVFRASWKRLKLTDDDLRALELAIMTNPTAAPSMRGTGGLRKIRFAPSALDGGKRGGARACYAYFGPYGLVYLCLVFAKSDQANLNAAERTWARRIIGELDRGLRENFGKGRTP